jgi:very-short-patch-repair endonuclease
MFRLTPCALLKRDTPLSPLKRGKRKSPHGRGVGVGIYGSNWGNMKRKKIIPYNPNLKEIAKQLRKNSTPSEILLWRYLKGKQMFCYDFDRQKPIDNFIVDFFCNELTLAIEIDGDTHNYKFEEDRKKAGKTGKVWYQVFTIYR